MSPTRITHVTVEPLTLQLTEPFAIATGAQTAADNILVRVTLADGTEGLGEGAPFTAVSGETQAGALEAAGRAREVLVERDARTWRALAGTLSAALPHAPAARCALEIAVLDALTRHLGVPLWAFFGGCGTALETDMTVTAGDRAHAEASARAILARGITTVKVKVGALPPEEDAARMAAIHAAHPTARLYADANGGYTVAQAETFLRALREARVPLALLEQPVPTGDIEGMAALCRSGGVPICADESARCAADVVRLVRADAAHAINLKVMKCGVVETLSMWAVARAAGLELMVGGMVESVLAMSFSAHLAAGLGGVSYADLDTPMFIAKHPFRGGFVQDGALLSLSHVERGHGVTLA
ncbi:MAG: dipeptide epimerase [Myxococcaceae bacterium]|nr:dipeptide epimerase [Myxococcaceae bacterium]MCI0671577.1 dipeptide epimerase [Myxococcaceae bacterium]